MRDLSALARDSMWVTSQEGGNMVHDNSPALTAPGSAPVTPVPKNETQPDPTVEIGAAMPVGAPARHPQPGTSFTASPVTWKVISDG